MTVIKEKTKLDIKDKDLSFWQNLSRKKLCDKEIQSLLCNQYFFTSPRDIILVERQHAMLIDQILKFNITLCEEKLQAKAKSLWDYSSGLYSHYTLGPFLHEGVQTWVGVDPQILNTPYSILLKILKTCRLKTGDRIIDLGAGYGRMGIVTQCLSNNLFYLGIEYAPSRVLLAAEFYKRWELSRSQIIQANITDDDFEYPEGEVYFIYDYGKLADIEKSIKELETLSFDRPLKVVARGAQTFDMIKNKFNWFKYVMEENKDFIIYFLNQT